MFLKAESKDGQADTLKNYVLSMAESHIPKDDKKAYELAKRLAISDN